MQVTCQISIYKSITGARIPAGTGQPALIALCNLTICAGISICTWHCCFPVCRVYFSWGCGDACTSLNHSVSTATETPNNTKSRGCRFAAPLISRGSEHCLGAAHRYCGAAEVGISSTFCYIYFYLISLIYCIIIYHMQISSNLLKLTFQLRDEIWKEVIRKNYFTSFCTLGLQGGSITLKI